MSISVLKYVPEIREISVQVLEEKLPTDNNFCNCNNKSPKGEQNIHMSIFNFLAITNKHTYTLLP